MGGVVWCNAVIPFGAGIPAQWQSQFNLSDGTGPIIALDFLHNRYFNGVSNTANLNTMVAGNPTVQADGMVATTHYSVIGPFLTALQNSAVTIVTEVTGANTAAFKGIMAGPTVFDQILVISDTNVLNSFTDGTTLAVSGATDWTAPTKAGTCFDASGRSLACTLHAPVQSDSHVFAPITAAVLGALDTIDEFPFTNGRIRTLAVYPVRAPVGVLGQAVTIPGSVTAIAINNQGGAYLNPGASTLAYEYTQPWTSVARVKLDASSNRYGAIFFTNCSSTTTVNGYEMWAGGQLSPTGQNKWLLFVRIIGDFPNNKYLGVYGSTNLNDGAYHTVAATYDGSGVVAGVKLYVDGAAETMTTEIDGLAGTTIVGNNQMQIFNQAPDTNNIVFFGGFCKYFSISSVERSASYIASLNVDSGVETATNIEMMYGFDTDSTTVADLSGNGRNATIVGTRPTDWDWV